MIKIIKFQCVNVYIKKKAKQNKQIKQSFYQTRRVNYYSETAAATTTTANKYKKHEIYAR